MFGTPGRVRRLPDAPRWLPIPLMLAVLAGSLVLYFALERKQDQDFAHTVRAEAEGARNLISVRMESRLQALARRAKDWEVSGAPTEAAWMASSASYVHDSPQVESLEWIDPEHRVRWIYPLHAEGAGLNGLTLDERHRVALEQAERTHQPCMTRIVSLSHGGLGFVVYAPIELDGKSEGFLATVFKADKCLARDLPPAVADGEAITIAEGGQTLYARDADAAPGPAEWMDREKIALRGTNWELRMWPAPALAARLDSPLPAVVLCAGVLCAILLGAVSFYAQRSAREAAETARANDALRTALEHVKTLEGLLPICCYCKRVRDDTGYWSQIDTYIRKHTSASFSHGYCPECAAKFYEECGLDVPDKVKAEIKAGNYE